MWATGDAYERYMGPVDVRSRPGSYGWAPSRSRWLDVGCTGALTAAVASVPTAGRATSTDPSAFRAQPVRPVPPPAPMRFVGDALALPVRDRSCDGSERPGTQLPPRPGSGVAEAVRAVRPAAAPSPHVGLPEGMGFLRCFWTRRQPSIRRLPHGTKATASPVPSGPPLRALWSGRPDGRGCRADRGDHGLPLISRTSGNCSWSARSWLPVYVAS